MSDAYTEVTAGGQSLGLWETLTMRLATSPSQVRVPSGVSPMAADTSGRYRARGYCPCWFGPACLHNGHCCFTGDNADRCVDHPATSTVVALARDLLAARRRQVV